MEGKIKIETLTTLDELRNIESEWSDLAFRCADDSPYLTPEFLLPWIDSIAGKLQIAVTIVWNEGRLVALAPLMHRQLRKFLISWRIKSFAINGTTPAFDILMEEPNAEILNSILDHWLKQDNWDFVWFHCIDRESKVLSLLEGKAPGAGLKLVRKPALKTWLLSITGNWEDYFSSRPKKTRNNSRRNWRNCQQWGEPTIIRYPDQRLILDDALSMAEKVIQKSWKRIGSEEKQQLQLLQTLARKLDASQILSMRFLLINGEVVAYLMEIVYRRNLFPFHNAYDIQYQRVSPGQLLLADAIQQSHDRQFGRVDFFGTMDYLTRWTDQQRSYDEVFILKRGFVARIKTWIFQHIHRRRQLAAKAKTDEKKNRFKNAQ